MYKIGAGIVVVALVLGIFGTVHNKNSTGHEFRGDHVSFQYPKDYADQSKPVAKTNQAQTTFKAGTDNPLRVAELAKEVGAIQGARFTKTNFLDFLENNSNLAFPQTYKNYKDVSTNRVKISGRDASLRHFTYTGADGKTTIYMNFFIMPLGNDAYYLSIQSTDKSRLDTDTKKIQSTLNLY